MKCVISSEWMKWKEIMHGAWGGDLIVFVVPGVGHLTDLVLPGDGIFESFFTRHGDI